MPLLILYSPYDYLSRLIVSACLICIQCITINLLHSIVRFFYLVGISYFVGFMYHCVFTFPYSVTDMLKKVLLALPFNINEALWLWYHLTLTDYCAESFSLQSSVIIGCNTCRTRNGLTLDVCMLYYYFSEIIWFYLYRTQSDSLTALLS